MYSVDQEIISRKQVGFIDHKLVFFRINFDILGVVDPDPAETQKIYEDVTKLINDFNEQNDESLQGFVSAFDNFPIWHLKSIFLSNSLTGIGLNLIFNLIVLILNTKNIYLSLIALLSIVSIIISLISMIPFNGWQFGLTESTCVIIYIGISFDYVVHICHQFNHSISVNRKGKMQDAYAQMGQTVFSSALTSLFSAFFLIVCQTDTLYKFGIFLLVTILLSLVVSLVIFPTMLFIFGPEREQGNLFLMI